MSSAQATRSLVAQISEQLEERVATFHQRPGSEEHNMRLLTPQNSFRGRYDWQLSYDKPNGSTTLVLLSLYPNMEQTIQEHPLLGKQIPSWKKRGLEPEQYDLTQPLYYTVSDDGFTLTDRKEEALSTIEQAIGK